MPQATCSNLLAPAADCPLLRPLLAKELGRERTGAGCAHVRAGRCVQPEQARSMSGSGGSAGFPPDRVGVGDSPAVLPREVEPAVPIGRSVAGRATLADHRFGPVQIGQGLVVL